MSDTYDDGERLVHSLTNMVAPSECAFELKASGNLAHDEGEQHVWSLPDNVAPSKYVRSPFNISESDLDSISVLDNSQYSDGDEYLPKHFESYFHDGIDLTGDNDNSGGILHDFEAKNPKTMLGTPSKGRRSFFVISNGPQLIHILIAVKWC